ncbi:MAG TPA: alpha/beta hydrolase [Solirubrobacterales bacterium]|nr:alpha/beta hydrolase [Solirubrobacterales bacterium]
MPENRRHEVTDCQRDELRALGAASRWIESDGRRLHVLDYGGEKPPLLVLPGITSPSITWDFIVAPLRDRVRPLVMDLRGRGPSDAGGNYGAPDFAADAAAAIDQLGLERPLVLGHSLGARIAAALAARGDVRLGLTVCVDPPLSGPGRGGYPTSRESFEAQLDAGYEGTTGDEVAAAYPLWPRSELLLRARWVGTCERDAVLATYDRFAEEDFLEWWGAVPAPAALINGGDSPVVTEAGLADARAVNPDAHYATVPGAGHMVPWDNLAGFQAAFAEVLETELAATRGDS